MKIKALFASIVLLLIVCSSIVYAVDNLVLYGVVKSIDKVKGEIVIDVKSGSCYGTKTFRFNPEEKGVNIKKMLDKKIRFMIDSSTCDDEESRVVQFFVRGAGK